MNWRRDRDSNPGSAQTDNGFRDRRIRPLCHLSAVGIVGGRISGVGGVVQDEKAVVLRLDSVGRSGPYAPSRKAVCFAGILFSYRPKGRAVHRRGQAP